MIAALFVETDGVYFNLPNVEPWDEARDARNYAGPHSVIAHPPCARWSQLAIVNRARWGTPLGEDNGCFQSAMRSVQLWGGVLEHPCNSRAFETFGITRPKHGAGWVPGGPNGTWTCSVDQCLYGHRARKRTWLFVCSSEKPQELNWERGTGSVLIGGPVGEGKCNPRLLPRMGKKESLHTPVEFRDLLISIAEDCK